MRIRYTKKIKERNGSEDTKSTEISKEEITLGRGANCDIILDSSLASLTHAKLYQSDSRVVIQDLGSLAGTKVGGKVITHATLRSGDVISLGDISLTYRDERGLAVLVHEITMQQEQSSEDRIKKEAESLDIRERLPKLGILSTLISAVVLIIFFLYPITKSKPPQSWSSGPLSRSHQFIEHDCTQCHGAPFEQVQDKKCVSCHELTPHAKAFTTGQVSTAHANTDMRCGSCHLEHNAEKGIIDRENTTCISCHKDIKAVYNDSKLEKVASLAKHPAFTLPQQDEAQIKFNHKIHLAGPIRAAQGKRSLECVECHVSAGTASGAKGTMKQIRFEKNCKECHTLEFDPRYPGKEVPHGDTDHVYQFLLAEYSALALGESNDSLKRAITPPQRLIPGEVSRTVQEQHSPIDPVQSARDAEQILYTKTGCKLCHTIDTQSDRSEHQSAFRITKPNIPERWFSHAVFSHPSHEFMSCKSCHAGVKDSELTTDILLPKIAQCQSCHADLRRGRDHPKGKVESECLTCHIYHNAVPLPEIRKREFSTVGTGKP